MSNFLDISWQEQVTFDELVGTRPTRLVEFY